jgi:hypothetical protein
MIAFLWILMSPAFSISPVSPEPLSAADRSSFIPVHLNYTLSPSNAFGGFILHIQAVLTLNFTSDTISQNTTMTFSCRYEDPLSSGWRALEPIILSNVTDGGITTIIAQFLYQHPAITPFRFFFELWFYDNGSISDTTTFGTMNSPYTFDPMAHYQFSFAYVIIGGVLVLFLWFGPTKNFLRLASLSPRLQRRTKVYHQIWLASSFIVMMFIDTLVGMNAIKLTYFFTLKN